MHVRPALDRDAAAIAHTEALAAASPWGREAIELLIDAPHGVVRVVEEQGEVCGHVLATAVAGEGEVLTVAVRPELRRRGLARALLVDLAQAWRAMGTQEAWLEVHADNHGARALYATLGWHETGRRRAYYADGGDALVLTLDLTAEVSPDP